MHTFLQGNPTVTSLVASVLMSSLLLASYFLFEPMVTRGQEVDQFTVRQEISSEIAFSSPATDVTMTPAISGITGDNAFGTSTVAVNTNNPTGYNMTIAFATTTAMQGENLNSDIPNYPAGSGTPDYNWSLPANTAGFGYTVIGTTNAADISDTFKDNGSACNTGSGTTVGKCWYMQSNASSTQTIINRTTATPGTGATTTIVFQVGVTANPSPAIESGFYTATATLTAVTN